MCGFFGLLGCDLDHQKLEKIRELLSHRGPDSSGLYKGGHINLLACRLSILDLQGGHQPMCNEEGTVWIVYNGETFNARDLREDLKKAGHRFRTHSDTEVLIHAYEQWEVDMLPRLRGMFAFSIWDAVHNRLLLARDRFGIKPLYYLDSGTKFAFASIASPLLHALPEVERRADPESLLCLFTLGFIPAPHSIFSGVKSLPAAHYLLIQDKEKKKRRYWQLDYPLRGGHKEQPLTLVASQFKRHLKEAVFAWNQSDVPVGCLLSGGIDSASIAYLTTEITGTPVHTFTIGFSSKSYDEAQQARETSRFLGSIHHEFEFSNQEFCYLREVIRHLEQPQCSVTSVPIYLLYKICHEAGFKVIITGEGSDELLGGYHWYKGERFIRPLIWLPLWLRRILAPLLFSASEATRRVFAEGTADPLHRYQVWQHIGQSDCRSDLFRFLPDPSWSWWSDNPTGLLSKRSAFDQFLFLDAHTRLVDFINFEVDRMSMAHSVEARTPFLDHKLWEFCAKLPPRQKLGLRMDKLLLRRGFKGHLPSFLLRRPKLGLASPHALWWRDLKMPSWVDEYMQPSALKKAGYFNPTEVLRLREIHREGKVNAAPFLTGVLTTQIWHEMFIKV